MINSQANNIFDFYKGICQELVENDQDVNSANLIKNYYAGHRITTFG